MIHQIETINRFAASVETLQADVWADEEDVADYYRTQYVYPTRDIFKDAKEFMIEGNLIEARKNKLRLTKLGEAYSKLGASKGREIRLELNAEQKFFLNKNMFLKGVLSDRVKGLLNIFQKDQNGNLFIYKNEVFVVKDQSLLNLLLQSGFLIDKNQTIVVAPEYLKKFPKLISQIPLIITPKAFKKMQEEWEMIAGIAEKYVFDYEKTRLSRLVAHEQSKNIDYTAKKNVAAGYDISSYNNKDSRQFDRFIEVKAGQSQKIRFFLTQCEFRTAEKLKAAYWIYYIYMKNHKPHKIYMFSNPIKSVMNNPKFNNRIDTYEIFEI